MRVFSRRARGASKGSALRHGQRRTLVGMASLILLLAILQIRMASYDQHTGFGESSLFLALEGKAWKLEHDLGPSRVNPSGEPSSQAMDQPTTSRSIVRFLYGIMSYDHKLEKRRRINIRRTYLAFYKDFPVYNATHRICALADWLQAPHGHPMLEQCQIIYTFVVGANPEGPTQLLEFNESFPLSIDPSQILNSEPDVTYLNIRENGKYGKSPTWFKYGLKIWKEHPHFDYIVKTDSDTALYPSAFFEMVQSNHLLPHPKNLLVYGGSPFDKDMCGYPEHDHCVQLQTPTYMGGAFYFLSIDLAEYITGPDCPRAKLFIPHEDMTTGNYVYSHPQQNNITWVGEPKGYELIWRHAVKNPKRLLYHYVQYLCRLSKKGILTEEQIQAWNTTLESY